MPNTDPEIFDIEDIIREFGSAAEDTPEEPIPEEESVPAAEEAPVEEAPVEEAPVEEAPILEELPVEDAPLAEEAEDLPGEEEYDMEFALPQEFFAVPEPAIFEDEVDTIRLDNVSQLQTPPGDMEQTKAIPSLDELAAEEAPVDLEATQAFQVSDLEATQAFQMPDTEEVKVADLGKTLRIEVPQQEEEPPKERRFVLHPQSNPIKELKKQLTAGPERLYYQLAEKGTGKLAICVLLNLVVSLLCGTVTALQAFGVVGEPYLRAVIFSQVLSMFVSALLGSFQLIEGAADLFRKRFSLNTLLGFAFLICIADALLAMEQLRVPCCAAFCLAMTFSQLASYHKRTTLSARLDTMRKASFLKGVHTVSQESGRKLFVTGEGQVDDYMKTVYERSLPEKLQSIYAMSILVLSLILGAATLYWKDVSAGVQVWAVSLLVALPAGSFIAPTRPVALLERRLNKLGTVLCGWHGLKAAAGKADYPLSFGDLFPNGCAKLNGTKFFGSLSPEEVVSCTAALMQATESGLTPLFVSLLETHNGRIYEADDLQAYEHGLGGQVNGVEVLAGSLSFLRQMGVEADESLYISQSICVAIDGELSGMFAITYDKDKSSAAGLHTLTSYAGLRPTIVAADPMLTGSFLRKKFGVSTKRVAFPDYPTRQALRNTQPKEGSKPLALVTKPGLAPLAYSVTAGRSAHTATLLGTIVQMVGGVVGIAMLAVLVFIGALHLVTPVNMFLYQLIWLVPGWLITEWTRAI